MDPEPSSLFDFFTSTDSVTVLKFITFFVLLICSALISAAEVALFSLSHSEVEAAEEAKSPSGRIIGRLLERPKKLQATLLVANNFVNIAVVLIYASLSTYVLPKIGYTIFGLWDVTFVLNVILVAFLILLFGEILPKIYANRNKIQLAYMMAKPIHFLNVIFSPLSMPMRSVNLFLHDKYGKQKSNISVGQLSHALDLTSEEDTTQEEQKILRGIVSFGNTDTRQVMRPRIDIFGLNEELDFSEVLEEIIRNGYSRVPVYKDNLDTVTGVIYLKDLLPHITKKTFDWVSLKREPFFVPENKKLDDLLKEFQEMKNHLAIVVDEYGGTSGLITLEDIIEEIVGDISDEFDDEDLIYSKIDDHTFVFEGKTALKDFYKIIETEDKDIFEEHKGESETIAGFLLEISGNFPKRGEVVIFEKYQFIVEALDKRRIKQIKVTLPHEK